MKRNYDINLLYDVFEMFEKKGKLPAKFKAHRLKGNYKGFWECHIKPDWLLIWKKDDSKKVITFTRTGTHSDLFS